ncbi:MAG: inorganic phosphate transporter [Chloroflexi bacterium]|nr:inorganic phosphate transporter [Chloroflexota bacterium]
MNETVLLIVAAMVFAIVTGANDGATMVAINLPNPAIRPPAAIAILAAAVVLAPLLVGARVADTLAHGLVSFQGRGGQGQFLGALVAALGVVFILQRRGLPTSLTLALLGAIVGTGVGLGLEVAWLTVVGVVLIGLVAPLVSFLAGLLAAWALAYVRVGVNGWTRLRSLGAVAYIFQSLAYATNDGQKMIAVLAIAAGLGATGQVEVEPLTQLLLGGLFVIGTLAGFERVAGRLGGGILPVRGLHVVASEFGAATSVLGSAALGAPVSMTQAATAALVGAGVSETVWRVRWEHAARIGAAWFVTLPAAALAGAVIAVIGGMLG